MSVNEVRKSMREELMSYLSNKPIYVFWGAYAVLTGVVFGIFFAVMSLVAIKWWVATLVIMVIGIIWGSSVYKERGPKAEMMEDPKEGKKQAKQAK